MKIDDVGLIEYSPAEERLNVLTHLAGLIIPVLIFIKCMPCAVSSGSGFYVFCCVLYGVGTALTFLASVIYHGAPAKSRFKKAARVFDHSMIYIAVAGTASGCVPIVYYQGFRINALLMLITAWLCVITGLVLTALDFEKYKAVRMALYIICACACAALGARSYFHLPKGAFMCFIFGSLTLICACILYKTGAKIKYVHSVFHVFVVIGLAIYYSGIYKYVFNSIK